LLAVHSPEYLNRLRGAKFVAGVVEIPVFRYVPGWVADRVILRPMRWATMGTVVAAREAMEHGLAINLSGGYHHASPNDGHGFSAYADVALAIEGLRTSGRLKEGDKVVYIDLDAHQGNGVCRTYFEDRRVFIYDQYNRHIFPLDVRAQRRIDCDASVEGGCGECDYLATLRQKLPAFLDGLTRNDGVSLGVYNAGTDIFVADQLGGMNVSAAGVLERDRFVLEQLIKRRIPTLVVLSGGYSQHSYELVAAMVSFVMERWGV
jgi:histone deacetylase 11